MFIIQVNHNGNTYWLRRTVWSSSADRATQYASREAAQAALDKAKPFMKANAYKAALIVEAAGA